MKEARPAAKTKADPRRRVGEKSRVLHHFPGVLSGGGLGDALGAPLGKFVDEGGLGGEVPKLPSLTTR